MANRIVRIIDCETTGLPEDEPHALCELGWVDLDLKDGFPIRNPKTFFVNPGHPIPPHIRAVHHISDTDVAAAMSPDQAVAFMLKDLGPDDVLCAHNAKFEQAFIDAGRQWICTFKVGLRAWPQFKSHGNQALRYELGIDDEPDFDPAAAMPPHRSLPDAYVTAHILRRALKMRPIERLIEISSEPALLSTFTFGKHRGLKFSEVPADYLEWIIQKSDLGEDEKFSAKYWLGRR